ncbi:protein ANTAGONIST OF LIKE HETEROCHROMATIN PROTEIN 1-like [Mauremys reevesii]|uniref:protein ANTAGONIST OF LIKE HETEROCHROMATIN PROTEIN 1-like n=1 Tax=Mauremys reevesii TaxID=260615 RepID=UPI00193FE0A6|nr:protein ANTAGONIST OF LIKE HETEROCHROMATIN PROTEIN 1-like [Mauremys reevesii]XP_039337475.1 protein ANTAGONIST OF LIKE HETEROCHROMATIN PROTEIN 1-like [Mauremys reevesii]
MDLQEEEEEEEAEEEEYPGIRDSQWQMLLSIIGITADVPCVDRRFWCRVTSTDWWDHIVMQTWDDQHWVQYFHMKKATFLELCEQLTPILQRKETYMRSPLPVQKRVAITVWKLATPDCYRSVAKQFGVGKSTVGKVVAEVTEAIRRVIYPKVAGIKDIPKVIAGFERMGFPNCAGAIDGSHVSIACPPQGAHEYLNRKGYYSIVMQALMDHRGRFMNVNVGCTGKVHNARVFHHSGVYIHGQARTLFPPNDIDINGVTVPTVILGDPAYPLLPWLMKPYPDVKDPGKKRFNYIVSKCRMVVECAFGRLKSRWRCLQTRLDVSVINAVRITVACCALHNLCEARGEPFSPEWTSDSKGTQNWYPQPESAAIKAGADCTQAANVRDALCAHIMDLHGPVEEGE